MGKEKTENLLKDFISKYFTQGEIEEFNSKFLLQVGQEQTVPDQKILENHSFLLNTKIDELITFASEKLDAEKFLSFLLYIGTFVITNGEMETALGIYKTILSATLPNQNHSDIQANAYLSIAEIYSRQAKWQDSFKNIKKAASLFKLLRNDKGLAKCENLTGTIYGDMGKISKAKEHFERSIGLLKNGSDFTMLGIIEINLGIINMIEENYDTAREFLNKALTNFRRTGDYKRIAEIHFNTGMLKMKMDKPEEAFEELEKSIALAEDLDYLPLLSIGYLSKAQLFVKQNDNQMALEFADRSLGISYRISDRVSIADLYKIKGIVQRNLNNYQAAENYFLTSLRINKEISNKLNYAETAFELGLLYKQTGRKKESNSYFGTARTYYKKIKALKELQRVELIMT